MPTTTRPPSPRRTRPSPLLTLILVLICEAVVVYGLVADFGCLAGGTGHAAFVCTSDSAKPWYERSMAAAAVIAPLGAGVGWWRRSWSIVLVAVVASLAVSIATLLWGLRTVRVG